MMFLMLQAAIEKRLSAKVRRCSALSNVIRDDQALKTIWGKDEFRLFPYSCYFDSLLRALQGVITRYTSKSSRTSAVDMWLLLLRE
jgi:hypothetical protein